MIKEEKFDDDTVRAAKFVEMLNPLVSFCYSCRNLQTVIKELAESFAEGTNYFDLLVDAFRLNIKNSDQHLRNFSIISMPCFLEKLHFSFYLF